MNTSGTYNNINYLLHKPSWGSKQPLIIFLHGIGERGNTITDVWRVQNNGPLLLTKTDDIVENKGGPANYFILAPQLPTAIGAWQVSYVQQMLEFAKKNLDIDHNRIYLMGLSLGGGGVWSCLQDPIVAPQIAAATVLCGTNMFRTAEHIVKNNIPVFIYHSVDDDVVLVSYSEKAYDAIRAAGGNVRFFRMSGYRHNIWSVILNNVHKAIKLSDGTMTVNAPTPYERMLGYSKLVQP